MRFKELFERAAPTPQLTNTPIAMFTVNVPAAKRGTDVADMQKALVALGYPLPRFGVDGIIGPETIGALKKFQLANQLPGNGIADKTTIAALNAALAANPQAAANLTPSTQADVKQRAAPVKKSVGVAKPLAPLATDAVTQGKVGEVLDLVAGPESRGHYDMMFGGKRQPEILTMTIVNANRFQKDWHKKMGSSAMGRYQIMAANLIPYAQKAGLDPNTELFSPANQDKMGIIFLREKGLDRWLSGRISDEQFLEGLSQVWAGVPSPSNGGNSFYGGVGLNKVKTQLSMDTALATLQKVKGTTATA